MSVALSVEELRERVDALTESIAELSGGMEGLRRELFASERAARELQAELDACRGSAAGFFATLIETVFALAGTLPYVGGTAAALMGLGALMMALVQISECDAPPEPMRLEGQGTVMNASGEHADLLGARCDFVARQVGVGRCLFEARCEGADGVAEVQPCTTDSYTQDTGEGGTSTSYFLRAVRDTGEDLGEVVSFSEYEQFLELKAGDSLMVLVFHSFSGRSVLESTGEWPAPGEE